MNEKERNEKLRSALDTIIDAGCSKGLNQVLYEACKASFDHDVYGQLYDLGAVYVAIGSGSIVISEQEWLGLTDEQYQYLEGLRVQGGLTEQEAVELARSSPSDEEEEQWDEEVERERTKVEWYRLMDARYPEYSQSVPVDEYLVAAANAEFPGLAMYLHDYHPAFISRFRKAIAHGLDTDTDQAAVSVLRGTWLAHMEW